MYCDVYGIWSCMRSGLFRVHALGNVRIPRTHECCQCSPCFAPPTRLLHAEPHPTRAGCLVSPGRGLSPQPNPAEQCGSAAPLARPAQGRTCHRGLLAAERVEHSDRGVVGAWIAMKMQRGDVRGGARVFKLGQGGQRSQRGPARKGGLVQGAHFLQGPRCCKPRLKLWTLLTGACHDPVWGPMRFSLFGVLPLSGPCLR